MFWWFGGLVVFVEDFFGWELPKKSKPHFESSTAEKLLNEDVDN